MPVPTSITFGYGTISKIGSLVRKYGNTVLVVSGRKSAKKFGYINKLIDLLDMESVKSIIYDKITVIQLLLFSIFPEVFS